MRVEEESSRLRHLSVCSLIMMTILTCDQRYDAVAPFGGSGSVFLIDVVECRFVIAAVGGGFLEFFGRALILTSSTI